MFQVMMSSTPKNCAKTPEERLLHLAAVVERIAAVRNLNDLMTIIRRGARELTAADGATLVLRDDDHCYYADEDAIGPLWKGGRFPLSNCISGWAMLNAQAVAIEDIYADSRIPHEAYRPTFVKSLSMVPIGRDNPLGAIGCYWAKHHLATPEELTLQQALADAAAVGFANLDLYRRLDDARQEAERKALEAKENEARFRATFEQAAVGIAHVGADGRFLRVNEKLCDIVGYSREKLLSLTFQDITHPDDLDADLKQAARVLAGEIQTYRMEKRYIHREGKLIWINLTASLIRNENGEADYFIAVVEDIQRRKEAELALRRSQAQLCVFVEQAPISIAMLDRDLNYIAVSRRWIKEYGRGHTQLIGLNHYTVHPDLVDEWKTVHRKALNGEFLSSAEDCWVQADGSTHWLRWAVHPWINEMNEIGGIIISLEDITARKSAEAEILASREQIRKMSAHIQSVREKEKARVAGEIHDELGGTLTALKLDVCWLAKALPENATTLLERTDAMAGLIDGAVEATRRIITELRPSMLDHFGLLSTIEWQGAQFEKRTGIECRVQCSKNLGDLDEACSITLFRICQEALTNVARHSGANRVDIDYLHDEHNVRLTIRDNGCGIAAGKLDKVVSYGMRGMAERAASIGGRISTVTPETGGLALDVIVPLGQLDQKRSRQEES